jgi:hypothetical protein
VLATILFVKTKISALMKILILVKKHRCLKPFAGFLFGLTLFLAVRCHPIQAQVIPQVWYVQAGANGDGTSVEAPLGTTHEVELQTRAGDLIIILPSQTPLTGGLKLKEGQELRGISTSGRKPILTNSDSTRMNGVGIMLADGNRIRNIRIEKTFASGIYGMNASNLILENLEVEQANTSGALTEHQWVLGGFPHGGVVLVNLKPEVAVNMRIIDTKVIDASGTGILWVLKNGAGNNIRVQDCKILGGSIIQGRNDFGIGMMSAGPDTRSTLEIADVDINGRMSVFGRNVVILADAQGVAKAYLRRVNSGRVGQDGILGVVVSAPASVAIDIEDCIVEKAETNIEGAMLNVPPFIPSRAAESSMSINVNNSIVRDPTLGPNTIDIDLRLLKNLALGSSTFMGGPAPRGSYTCPGRHLYD